MELPRLVRGYFVARDNRFRARVRYGGAVVDVHVPNSGRLRELLSPGRPVWLAPMARAGRKTAYDLALVEYGDTLVSVDARLPNALFAQALAPEWAECVGVLQIEREVVRGTSRLDFRLSGTNGVCWVEVKSVTLVREGVALFPDAPTLRGRRHLEELAAAVASGNRAGVAFMVQRGDACCFRPNRQADPSFADTLARVTALGVQARAFLCQVTPGSVTVAGEIPVSCHQSLEAHSDG